ncbi:hypothetical protein Lal_00002284 [Lupinus albus]|uniref:Putative Coiled-coil domain-containing protein n=1 Tax=Lupinus albus TaxID=3870 RepID=A0A6A5PAA6_LUPAL|nr:putative Coiled-coil domain-containing protein [Lupinus albus]KAF1893761.1 hypothetical protein Lal_00002284 [Lupinus albus]
MGEQSKSESNNRTNPISQTTTKKKNKKKSEFEFCKVCNINHNQGLRHKYFPNHNNSLSNFLSRFRNKLSDLRFFLNNPIPLVPQFASRNRFWCVFCDEDVDEFDSSFACANAIHHLASFEHVKNLKHFFWKYGGAMDQLNVFTVSDDDLAKWQKRCMALKNEAGSSSEGCRGGAVIGPSSDIHNQHNNGNIDSFDNVYSHSVKSHPSNGVLPLQCYTNEYQVSYSGLSGVGNAGLLDNNVTTPSLPSEISSSGANPFSLQNFAVEKGSQSLPFNGTQCSSGGNSSNKGVCNNGGMVNGDSSHEGLQMLTQISSTPAKIAGGNVHSGAPPPWFEATEGVQMHSQPVLRNLVSHSTKSGKSKKLNPKRVGAAWAERRKIELEMEKRGETVRNECDANWLPNFGRVWQSGSRKESRKEFEREKQKLSDIETQPEMQVKIQPYVSKRMRMDSGGDHASG